MSSSHSSARSVSRRLISASSQHGRGRASCGGDRLNGERHGCAALHERPATGTGESAHLDGLRVAGKVSCGLPTNLVSGRIELFAFAVLAFGAGERGLRGRPDLGCARRRRAGTHLGAGMARTRGSRRGSACPECALPLHRSVGIAAFSGTVRTPDRF